MARSSGVFKKKRYPFKFQGYWCRGRRKSREYFIWPLSGINKKPDNEHVNEHIKPVYKIQETLLLEKKKKLVICLQTISK